MKKCPTCETSFEDDKLKFCQADGTPLVPVAEPVDPYKTMVGSGIDLDIPESAKPEEKKHAEVAKPLSDVREESKTPPEMKEFAPPVPPPAEPINKGKAPEPNDPRLKDAPPASPAEVELKGTEPTKESAEVKKSPPPPPVGGEKKASPPPLVENKGEVKKSPPPPPVGGEKKASPPQPVENKGEEVKKSPPPPPVGGEKKASPPPPVENKGEVKKSPPPPSPFTDNKGSDKPANEAKPSTPAPNKTDSKGKGSSSVPIPSPFDKSMPPGYAPPSTPPFNPNEPVVAEKVGSVGSAGDGNLDQRMQHQGAGSGERIDTSNSVENGEESPNQILAISAMVAGILSMTLCCGSVGLLLGPFAVIGGQVARSRADTDPDHYGGGTFGLIGMATGALGFFLSLAVLLIWVLGALPISN